jgi:hypothetical protein
MLLVQQIQATSSDDFCDSLYGGLGDDGLCLAGKEGRSGLIATLFVASSVMRCPTESLEFPQRKRFAAADWRSMA